MALTPLVPQALSDAGVAPSYTAVASGNTYTVVNSKPILLHFKNTGGGAATVTFTAGAVGGERKSSTKTVVVPLTSGDVMVGNFDPSVYIDKSNPGKVSFTVSTGSGVTVAAIQLPLVDQRKS